MASQRHVALLRGINVGAHHRLKMADLRPVFEALGFTRVETYLQSGNVVFTATATPVAATLERAFAKRFGFDSAIILRTRAELAAIATRNPFVADEADHAKLHVLFTSAAPTPGTLPQSGPVDHYAIDGREAYVWYRNGAGQSKLKLELGVPTTARNWRTVINVLAMLDA